MSASSLTGSQTVGPFFGPALLREDALRQVLVRKETRGRRIRIEGRVVDGDGMPVPDAMVEIWQADAAGRYHHPADGGPAPPDPSFIGFGRSGTGEDGGYWFETIKPGAVRFDATRLQAPHICVTVFARGLLNHVATRLYFPDDPEIEDDPVLHFVPEERRKTLIASREEEGGVVTYRFDVVLQGAGETAFFQV